MSAGHLSALHEMLAAQPPWSDLPILILTRPGADSEDTVEAVRVLGNVTLIERPVRRATLVTALRSALRARERQHQIREHLAERTRSEESLLLADRRKDEFLATLSHELRNPLAPLQTAVQILKTAGGGDSASVRARELMERQISHLVRLVNDLLEVSRITRGLIEVQPEPVDLSLVLRSAVETSRPAVDAAGHDLHVETARRAGDRARGHSAPDAGLLQPAQQRGQVHAARRSHPRAAGQGGGACGRLGPGRRHRHPRRPARVGVRDVHPGGPVDPPRAGRARDRSHAGAEPGRDARRPGGGAQRRARGRERVRGDAAGRRRRTLDRRQTRRRRPQHSRRGGSSSSTTTRMRPIRSATCWGCSALRCPSPTAAPRRSTRSRSSSRTRSCSTSACRRWTATRWRAGSDRPRRGADVLLIALTGWGQEHDHSRSRHAGLDHHLVKPPDVDKLRELLARH